MKPLVLVAVLFFLPLSLFSQDKALMDKVSNELKLGRITVSDALTDDAYMQLHPETAFRELIRRHAAGAHIRLASDKEPGKKITVKGLIVDRQGKPQSNVNIYVYQTSDKGWYGIDRPHFLQAGGDFSHARLFGYLKSDVNGQFSFETIKPEGYPDSDLPAHIHIHLQNAEGRNLPAPPELLFDDDPRLTAERRKSAIQSGFLIAGNTGTELKPVYSYKLIIW